MKAASLLLICVIAFTIQMNAQVIPNASFETWVDGSPENWDTSNEDLAMFQVSNVSPESADPKEGSTSLNAETLATAFFTLSGIVCNGYYEGPNPVNGEVETIKGVPFTATPTSFNLWYKCEPMPDDSALIYIQFSKGGTVIGEGRVVPKESVPEWTNLDIPIEWEGTQSPDSMLILVKSSYGTTNALGGAVANSTIWIDDLKLTGLDVVTGIPGPVDVDLKVFPNPFDEHLQINTRSDGVYDATIYNLQGKVLTGGKISAYSNIPTTFLKPGLYLLDIRAEGFVRRFKVIKR